LQRYTPEKAFKELIPIIPALLEHLELTATKMREAKENEDSDLVFVKLAQHIRILIPSSKDTRGLRRLGEDHVFYSRDSREDPKLGRLARTREHLQNEGFQQSSYSNSSY